MTIELTSKEIFTIRQALVMAGTHWLEMEEKDKKLRQTEAAETDRDIAMDYYELVKKFVTHAE